MEQRTDDIQFSNRKSLKRTGELFIRFRAITRNERIPTKIPTESKTFNKEHGKLQLSIIKATFTSQIEQRGDKIKTV